MKRDFSDLFFFWTSCTKDNSKWTPSQFHITSKPIPRDVKSYSTGHYWFCLTINSFFVQEKISKIKRGKYKHIKFRSFKHYSADLFKETLTSKNFPNYQNFSDATEAYDDLIQKLMVAIDKVAPIKGRRIKHYSQK